MPMHMQENLLEFMKNVELLMVVLYTLNIIMIICWLIFDNGWYTAYCSEFIAVQNSSDITLPETWTRSEYKGCSSTGTVTQENDTLLYFGFDSFTAAKTADATTYYHIAFDLAKDMFFSQWEALLWILCALSLLGIICGITYWTVKSQSSGIMYMEPGVRNIFGPGAGLFSIICFIIAMMAHFQYRHDVKASPNIFKDVANLGYGSNFTVSVIVIIFYGIISACSLSLFFPDKEALSRGRRTRQSMARAMRASNAGLFGFQESPRPRQSRRVTRNLGPQQRRSRAQGRHSTRHSVRRK